MDKKRADAEKSLLWLFNCLIIVLIFICLMYTKNLIGSVFAFFLAIIFVSFYIRAPRHYERKYKSNPFWIRPLILFFAVVLGLGSVELNELKKQIELKKGKERFIAYFEKNKPVILTEIENSINVGELDKASELLDNYSTIEDISKTQLYSKYKSKREFKLVERLKHIPSSELELNRDLYKELWEMFPNNEMYKDKYYYYKDKFDAVIYRKRLIDEQFSAWDGSHYNLERMIKRMMNDPDSYEHIKTVYWDRKDYLIVSTTFRGRNGFGGMVINTIRAKVNINTGHIIQMLN